MATSTWQKMVLILLGLILSLVLLEAGLRLGGFVLLSIQEYGNLRSIKQKGAYRILCLGESTTQGQYPHLLEQVLNQRNIGVHFSVIDKGRPGTNTTAILSRVESYLDEYHPDAVVTMMGINEGGKHIPFETATTSKRTLFIRSLRTYKLARLLWLHLLIKAKEIGFYKFNEEGRSSGKVRTYLPEVGLKETSGESVLTKTPLKKAIELNPHYDPAYFELGRTYKDQDKYHQAENLFRKAIELNPKNDYAYLELGRLYREQDKFPQAEDLFRKAIELNSKNSRAYAGLGWLFLDQGKYIQAGDLFKKALESNPKDDNACIRIGIIYLDQDKFSQAEDLFRKAIELNPKNDYAYLELGRLYREQEKFPLAEDLFRKAIELNPKNERVLGAMSSLYEEIGKPELAKEYAEKADRLRSEDYPAVTIDNYHKLKAILDQKRIKLVCVQYPMRDITPLKKIFEKDKGVIFVDNKRVFKESLKKEGYKVYFSDMFAGDFGHCTPKGNMLLAQNIADVILKEVFKK